MEIDLVEARRWLKDVTSVHAETWDLGNEKAWSFDQGTGELAWRFANGKKASAEAQIVGTFVPGASQWLWAWDNVSVGKKYAKCAAAARRFGEKHSFDVLIRPSSLCTLKQAWDLAAFAAKKAKAPADPNWAGQKLVYAAMMQPYYAWQSVWVAAPARKK